MKGKIPILFFIFFLMLLVGPGSASDYYNNGTLELEGSGSQSYDITLTSTNKYIDNPLEAKLHYYSPSETGDPIMLEYQDAQLTYTGSYSAIPSSVGGPFVIRDGGTDVGTGSMYIFKIADQGTSHAKVDIYYYFDEGFVGETGKIYDMPVYTDVINDYYNWINVYQDAGSHPLEYNTLKMAVSPDTAVGIMYTHASSHNNVVAEYTRVMNFKNDYTMTFSSSVVQVDITKVFSGYETGSKLVIRYDNGTLFYETGYSSSNYSYAFLNNTELNYYIEPEYSGVEYLIYSYPVSSTSMSGVIELNQTSYVDPEHIEVEWNISGYDATSYNYVIQVTSTLDGDVSGSFWEASGSWNNSTLLSSATGTALFDFYSDMYDLTVWIRAELWAYDKTSGTWSVLDYSPAVNYYDSFIPSEISTDKSSYNISEVVTVTYTSYADDIAIRAYQHGSITTYWKRDLATGTDNTVKFVFDEKDVGTWQIRLMENNVMVNYTSITITEGDNPYVKWEQSVYDEGQIAPYLIGGSGGLVLYSTDVNATLSVFDAANTEIYNISVGSGSNKMLLNLPESAAPGVWTASLLNLGTHYNDTTVVSSSTPVISFNSSVYKTGESIGINYFLPGDSYRIMLLDANNKEIVIFTTLNGVISAGTYQTVPFPLTDNNIYGFDVVSAIDAGTYSTGYWSVWVTDQYGTLVEDGTVWDRAKVELGSSTPEDSSSEMISIFFSAEGLFMIFTAALTLMGLVAAKHPAGGGAGATIGVGFGVYFNALPVWLLMLTVILLVVLAGVSVAIYFKGK